MAGNDVRGIWALQQTQQGQQSRYMYQTQGTPRIHQVRERPGRGPLWVGWPRTFCSSQWMVAGGG